MRKVLNLIDILGFILTFVGTYLAIMSDKTIELISEGLTRWCLLGVIITSLGWYNYYHNYFLAKSVIDGRKELQQVHLKIIELKDSKFASLDNGLKDFAILCQYISKAFRKFHSSEISVCMHYTNIIDGNKCVEILARNTDSESKRSKNNRQFDYIDSNSDFKKIIEGFQNDKYSEHYYFTNFSAWNPNYKNTHLPDYFTQHNYLRIFRKWPLPYKSAIVVPIKIRSKNKIVIRGFLSVDSDKTYAFSKKYDLPILIDMADAIAPLFKKFSEKHLLHQKKEA